MSLRLEELDAIYGTVSHEEAVAIANLGAQCYTAAKEQLFATWEAIRDDTGREELWRKEGRMAMLESLKGRLAAGDAAQARIVELQGSMDVEIARRVSETLSHRMREVELSAREQIMLAQREVTELKCELKLANQAATQNELLTFKVEALATELQKYKESEVKSSHMIGKIGEATVYDLLDKYVCKKFIDSTVVNVATTKHVGDIHMIVPMITGKPLKIMIDVKNYTRNSVDTKEVEKLYRDLDEHDSDVGLLISLVSGISRKRLFQISKTPKGKACLFLSFEGIDEGMRAEMLCWAVRVLMGIVSVQDISDKDKIMSELREFIYDLSTSLEVLETHVRTAKQHYEALETTKYQMLRRIQKYTSDCGIDVEISAKASTKPLENSDIQCKGLNMKGGPCRAKKNVVDGYCKKHTPESGAVPISDDLADGATIEHL